MWKKRNLKRGTLPDAEFLHANGTDIEIIPKLLSDIASVNWAPPPGTPATKVGPEDKYMDAVSADASAYLVCTWDSSREDYLVCLAAMPQIDNLPLARRIAKRLLENGYSTRSGKKPFAYLDES